MTFEVLPHADETEWLAQRASRVTATDIARLANGGPATWAAVKAEKLTGTSKFSGNKFTEYGHEREPVIASYVDFAFDVAPNNNLFVHDGGVWAATPDGYSDGVNGEYKTSNRPLAIASPADLRKVKPAYYDQTTWAMLVDDARECVFAWEEHENFVPGDIHHIIVPRDEERIKELTEIASRFLDYLHEEEKPTEFGDLIAQYREKQAAVDEAQAELDAVKDAIRERAGDREVSEKTPFGSLSYAWPKPRVTFDQTRFKKDHPDLAAEYTKTSAPSKPTLRVS